jgi:hypothetical protein
MALAGKTKTARRTRRSLEIQAFIRETLANGPVDATRMHDELYKKFDLEPHSSIYHAKSIGVQFIGKNPRARVWDLPKPRKHVRTAPADLANRGAGA